jgi:hypothetical protein
MMTSWKTGSPLEGLLDDHPKILGVLPSDDRYDLAPKWLTKGEIEKNFSQRRDKLRRISADESPI